MKALRHFLAVVSLIGLSLCANGLISGSHSGHATPIMPGPASSTSASVQG